MIDLEKITLKQKEAAEAAVKDRTLLLGLLDGLLSKSKEVRYENFKVLCLISKQHPEVVYGQWGFFENFLKPDDDSKKFYAIHILANLAKADTEGKFESLFDDFYGILKGDSFISASHVAYVSGKIVAAKPELADNQ
jgi:glutamine synthetase type III